MKNDPVTRADLSAVSTLLRRYAFFEGEAPPPAVPPVTPPVTPPASAGNSANGGNNGDTENPAWLPDRLARAAKAEREKLLKELGIEDADADKALLAEARKRKEDEKTETQKLADQVKALEADKQAALQRADALESERRTERRSAAVEAAAREARAEIPGDVVTWAEKEQPDALAKVLSKEGKADPAAVSALIDAAKKARPSWFRPGGMGSPSNSGGRALPADDSKKKVPERPFGSL